MAANLKEVIAARIRTWQTLLDLLNANPEMEETIRSLFASNGSGSAPHGYSTAPTQPPLIAPSLESQALSAHRARGALTNRVHDVLKESDTPTTTEWIANRMMAEGYEFKAAKPIVAVNEALRTLQARGLAEVTGKQDGLRKLWKAKRP